MNTFDKRKHTKARQEIIRKGKIIQAGQDDEFWMVMKGCLKNEIEAGRDALESPTQTREINLVMGLAKKAGLTFLNGVNVKNDMEWMQYCRGVINALRIVLEKPDILAEQGRLASKTKRQYKEDK